MRPFHPSPAQARLLDWALAHPACASIGDLCRASGTPRSCYYYWSRNPAFCSWFASAWSSRLFVAGSCLINHARLQAPGSFHNWRALFELTFDPCGLAQIARWQQPPVSCPTQQNQPLSSSTLGKSMPSPGRITPLKHVRRLQKSLGAMACCQPGGGGRRW